uniref:Uncharacterized protein n=1 Tax=Tetranychus urticae TaxID=32264 RepID=T1JZL5_TETUR
MPVALLYTNIPAALSGSMVCILTGTYTYITRKTPPKYRAIRFAILELFMLLAMPTSTTVGGYVLALKPWFSGQHRNYIGVLVISIISSAVSALWVAILLNDAGTSEEEMNNNNGPSSGDSPRNNRDELGKPAHSKDGPKSINQSFWRSSTFVMLAIQ